MNLQRKLNRLNGYQFYQDLSAEKNVPRWFMLMIVKRLIVPKERVFVFNDTEYKYGSWVIMDERNQIEVLSDERVRTWFKKWEEVK